MKVGAMRAIDRWAGIPICFLLTLARLPFGRAPFPAAPRRILFIELSEMGSAVLADPAMRKARGAFGAELHFLIFRRNAESLALLGTVPRANICTIREDSFAALVADTLRFFFWARRRRIDACVDLEMFSRFSAILAALCGAVWRVGFHRFHAEGLYRGNLLTHRVAYNPHIHIAKNFIALVNALAAQRAEVPFSKTVIGEDEITLPRILPGERESRAMEQRVAEAFPPFEPRRHRLILFNPNASELLPQRRWPAEHFAQLARRALERWDDAVILITGASEEAAEADELRRRVGHARMVNFAGRLELRELPLLYGIAALMVTNDSGPGHFASVTDMPTIVLFGPETPALYGPLGRGRAITAGLACSPCVSAANNRRTACADPVCMAAIPPERVLDAMAEFLDAPDG